MEFYNEIKNGRLIKTPYFQRNLVWRDIHKHDFIKTILDGYPFPLIFIAKGDLDVEQLSVVSCIVDGQQRSNAIEDYINDKFPSCGKKYSQLSSDEKSAFLRYEIPVVELDLDYRDPRVIETFKRLNRASGSLTAIEKQSSEFGASEYMLVAKMFVANISPKQEPVDDENKWFRDPNVTEEFYQWANTQKMKSTLKVFSENDVFTPYEISRQVNLQYALDIMSSVLGGYFDRHDRTKEFLELKNNSFEERDNIVKAFEQACTWYLRLKLHKSSLWRKKAGFFSLLTELTNRSYLGHSLDLPETSSALAAFEQNVPPAYTDAARNSVNDKNQRLTRRNYVLQCLKPQQDA